MSNNINIELSDENLIKLIINQFNSWTCIRRKNVLILKSCELFENSITNKLESFLKRKIHHLPIPYIKSKTNIEKEYSKYSDLFKKYEVELDKINNFSSN